MGWEGCRDGRNVVERCVHKMWILRNCTDQASRGSNKKKRGYECSLKVNIRFFELDTGHKVMGGIKFDCKYFVCTSGEEQKSSFSELGRTAEGANLRLRVRKVIHLLANFFHYVVISLG